MNNRLLIPFLLLLVACSSPSPKTIPDELTLSKDVLLDKVKGGWAGQVIGCTYGGPTEFKYTGTMINDYVPIHWNDGCVKWWYENSPGLYDDVYMDLTFVKVLDRLGPDAPADSFALAFANAGYSLWHANQAARYNILRGIMPPASGYWENNPHSDDLDYQIEADFAGLMNPGMPNSASEISDKIGHIMTYGDGWYGGVFVGAMYSMAFISDDLEFVVGEALKTIPEKSKFYQCISDVIRWHKEFPTDWKQTWFECERKWSNDVGCPHGTFRSYNIDAVINSAYIVIGLLYGEKDFFKTMDISTRCGQDSDCNPASAAGILGTMIGYRQIPEYWMKNLREVEDMDLAYTSMSLNDTYQMGFNHALQMIERNGGSMSGDQVSIRCQKPERVKFEVGFEGLYPIEKQGIHKPIAEMGEFVFEGTGVVFNGGVKSNDKSYVARMEVFIDGNPVDTAVLPVDSRVRNQELYWKYKLPATKHTVTFKWLNPQEGVDINVADVLVYSDKPATIPHQLN